MTTATAPRTYTATLAPGREVTRTTRSPRLHYTHVRVIAHPRGDIVSWHTSYELAVGGRVDVAEWRNYAWTVVAVEQTAGPGAPATPVLELELGPIDRGDLTGEQYLGTLGRGRTVHLVLDRTTRNTACDARPARNAVGVVYDRDAVVTCTRCTKAHRA